MIGDEKKEIAMDYDSLLALVKKRRSIRRFKPDPISDESIDKIIEVARWAPSGFNLQPWEFVVVKKPELRKRFGEKFMRDSKKMVHYDDCGQEDFRDENEVKDFVKKNWTIGSGHIRGRQNNRIICLNGTGGGFYVSKTDGIF